MKCRLLSFLFFGCATLAALAQSPGPLSSSDISNLLKKAKEGHTESQVKLGLAFEYGSGVHPDLTSAEYWLKTAAGFGDPDAQTRLGMLYLKPELRPQHAKEAMQWFLRAAASGYAPAEHNLGSMNLRGWGTPANESEALRWFRKAARRGLVPSKVLIGIVLSKSTSEAERLEGFEAARDAAKAKDRLGMVVFGYYHQFGVGTKQSLEEAAKWYQRAADAGEGLGMHNLAAMYRNGSGVPKDLERSVKLSKQACDAGVQRSCVVTAAAFLQGEGVRQNLPEAYRYGLRGELNDRFMVFSGANLSEDIKRRDAAEAERWKQDHLQQIEWAPPQ
jgi:TPR repeat protein